MVLIQLLVWQTDSKPRAASENIHIGGRNRVAATIRDFDEVIKKRIIRILFRVSPVIIFLVN